jgi:hypothetical protein
MNTNHLCHLTTLQRNHLHAYLLAEQERARMAGDAEHVLRLTARLSELAQSHGPIALDRHEYAAAMQLEAA